MSEEKAKSKAAEAVADEMGRAMEKREESRREGERSQWVDLNQGIQTGTHASEHPEIHWGRHRLKDKRAKPNQEEK